jgi:adenosylcobinamide-phosphate synthase
MIGHRTPRHKAFGRAAARFDDLINLPASRLTALLIVLAAFLVRGADARNAWRAVRRDAKKHRSPNAGWPEAAMAGALGLAPAQLRRVMADDIHGRRRPARGGSVDIRRARNSTDRRFR